MLSWKEEKNKNKNKQKTLTKKLLKRFERIIDYHCFLFH